MILRSWEDPSAFGELFERHAGTIRRGVGRRITPTAADDVVAETFLRAFERRRRFSLERESALPWLFGFAMNLLRHHHRAERRTVGLDLERADGTDPVGAAGDRIDAVRRRLEARYEAAAAGRRPAPTRRRVLTVAGSGSLRSPPARWSTARSSGCPDSSSTATPPTSTAARVSASA